MEEENSMDEEKWKILDSLEIKAKRFEALLMMISNNVKNRDKNKVKRYSFETTKINKWKENHVKAWLNAIGFPVLIGKVKSGQQIGELLLNNELFHDFSECFLKYFSTILLNCQRNIQAYYTMEFQRVLEKVVSAMDAEGFNFKSYFEISNLASVLSNKEMMKKLYFNPNQRIPKRFRVTVVITENLFQYKDKLWRMTLAPIQDMVSRRTFGLFHSSVVVGPWYFSWSDIELVIPKRIGTRNAFLAFDCTPGEWVIDKLTIDDITNKICDCLIKWNGGYTYTTVKKKERKAGNCQDFVHDLCKCLGVDIEATLNSGAFANFMKKIRKYGRFKMEFCPSLKFQEMYKFEANEDLKKYKVGKGKYKIVFKTHKEIDQLWNYCRSIEPFLEPDLETEAQLLKSFDRAFWLRHLKDRSNPIYKPLSVEEMKKYDDDEDEGEAEYNRLNTGCPFKDPTITRTFAI